MLVVDILRALQIRNGIVLLAVCPVGDEKSVTVRLTFVRPAAEGVPLITPVVLLSDKPDGSVPLTLKVRGGTPPVADNVVEYDVPKYPCGKAVVDSANASAAESDKT